jgi:ribosomal protein L33
MKKTIKLNSNDGGASATLCIRPATFYLTKKSMKKTIKLNSNEGGASATRYASDQQRSILPSKSMK